MNGNCPECGEFLGKKRSCECGYKQNKKENTNIDIQCCWRNKSGNRCQMMGSVSAGKEWYCTWHHKALSDPEWAEDYEQFSGWRDIIKKEYRSTEWLPIGRVWVAIMGGK